MKKIKNKITAAVIVVALVAGVIFGGYKIYDNFHSGVVNVYSAEYLMTTYWGDEKQSSGQVSTDRLQAEYLSSTQTVEEIKVSEGQKVKKGDVLFTYDSTLSDLDLKRKKINVQQKELELTTAKKELAVIRTYRGGVPIPGSGGGGGFIPPAPIAPEEPAVPVYEGLDLISGKGTVTEPFCYEWKNTFSFTDDFLAAAMQGQDEAFVTFYLNGSEVIWPEQPETQEPESEEPETKEPETKEPETKEPESDSRTEESETQAPETQAPETQAPETQAPETQAPETQAPETQESETIAMMPRVFHHLTTGSGTQVGDAQAQYSAGWTMHCQHTINGYRYIMVSMNVGGINRVVSQPLPAIAEEEKIKDEEIIIDDGFDDFGGGIIYTWSEIGQMIAEKEAEIKKLDIEHRQLELEAVKLEKELTNSAVYAEYDGTIVLLNDPDDLEQGTPLLKLSGGGGYVVHGTISELDLETVFPGQMVTVNDWMSGNMYTGEIREISEYPTMNSGYWGNGNSNVSYYSFIAVIDETANMEAGSYVDITLAGGMEGESQNMYLEKSFIRSEGGKDYILVDNDGTLEKRYIKTGKDLWGSYAEIVSRNLDSSEYIAFPYGQKTKAGAKTRIAEMDELYSY